MIGRTALIQGILIAFVLILFWTGALTLETFGPFLPAIAILLVLYFGASVFLGWKFIVQPRLHGFRFNRSQDKDKVTRQFSGFPVFYDTSGREEEFKWVPGFEEDCTGVLEEVRGFLANGSGEKEGRQPADDAFNTAYQNEVLSLSPTWKTLNLMSYGTTNQNAQLLPRTREIVSRLPSVFTCNLSKLAPRTELRPHAGESTCYIRCHLGIEIPAMAPVTALHVAGEERSWEEGKVMAFCDGQWHGAHNRSDEERYVLIFDIMPSRLEWYTKQYCALMVALNVTQYLLPGRVSLDEPLWRPKVLLGYFAFATAGVPILAGMYAYFRFFCSFRTPWMKRLSKAGFGFYY